jgi:putative transposase
MARPRNLTVPGAAYYVTAVLVDRLPLFLYRPYCEIVLEALQFQRQADKMRLHAFVLMPDHLHCVLSPRGERSASDLTRDVKTYTAKRMRERLQHEHAPDIVAVLRRAVQRTDRQSFKVWQDGVWVRPLLTVAELLARVQYTHANPVRAGLAVEPARYPWSSARAYEQDEPVPIAIDRIQT